MANRERQDPNPDAYEGKEYLALEEAGNYLGLKRSALYNSIAALKIETRKFKLSRKHFLSLSDIERIKEAREKPWLIEPDKE